MTDETKFYKERDLKKLGKFYTDHMSALTEENLIDKSDIAAELAWRDKKIQDIVNAIAKVFPAWKGLDGTYIIDFRDYNHLVDAVNDKS